MVNNMFILSACDDGSVLTTIRILLIVFDVIKSVVAMIIIILGIKDFIGVTTNGKDEKLFDAFKMLIRRIIAGLVVFFIPTIIGGVLNSIDAELYAYNECILKATPEEIQNAYYKKAKQMIKGAKDDLDSNQYADAKAYLDFVTDSGKKKELETELKEVDGYISLYNEISAMNDPKQYDGLKERVNKVSDSSVKTKLLAHLEEQKKVAEETQKKKENFEEEKKKKEQEQQQQQQGPSSQADLGGTVVKSEETSTLKVTIRKVNTYYLTQVWVKDPYNQLNKFDSPQYGSSLYRPASLLQSAVNQKGLSNKLVVGFNASGFYLKDTYDASSVSYYPPYNKTSVGTLVITDGKVVRNAYNKAYKTWFIAGVDKSGTLQIYVDEKTNDTSAKQAWANNVISNIRNTFTFASPLVLNGQASSITTSMPSAGSKVNRQAICQIDNNNFLLITGSNLDRQDLINIMLTANCKTGTNFDGGGSIALLYKSKNSTNIETIIGGGRALTEVGYFTE